MFLFRQPLERISDDAQREQRDRRERQQGNGSRQDAMTLQAGNQSRPAEMRLAGQGTPEVLDGGETCGGIAGQRLGDGAAPPRANLFGGIGVRGAKGRIVRTRQLRGKHLKHRYAQRVDIGTSAALALQLLGRHVLGSTHDLNRLRYGFIVLGTGGQTEVGDLDDRPAGRRQQHYVSRLEVAMHDAQMVRGR